MMDKGETSFMLESLFVEVLHAWGRELQFIFLVAKHLRFPQSVQPQICIKKHGGTELS